MDPPSRVQSFYHSAMMPSPWLCTLTEEEEEEDTLLYELDFTEVCSFFLSYDTSKHLHANSAHVYKATWTKFLRQLGPYIFEVHTSGMVMNDATRLPVH